MPKIIGETLEEHRERVHERIFTAFQRLLGDRGYDAVTLADVAGAAGVGRTAMYNYYPDKESLLIAFTAHETGKYVQQLQAALDGVANPIERLQIFVRMQLKHLATQHFPPSSLSNVLTEPGRKKMLEHIAPLWDLLHGILTDAIEQRYLPEDDAELLLPLVTASISGRSTSDLSGKRLDHAIDTTTTYVLRGLGVRMSADGKPRRLPAR